MTVSGKVDVAKAAAKTAFLSSTSAGALNNVFVYNALDGAQLGTAAIGTDGSFSNLTFTLPATKTILVFKAVVGQGTFRTVVPIDLSNPPAAGAITGSNPISIVISQDSTNRTILESQLLGLTGILGDANQTLASVSKTYTDAAALWINNGGQALAYSTNGLALSGKFSSAALLPAQDANILGAEDLNNMTLDGSISSVSIPGNKPIVSFTVTNKDTGKGIRGLKAFNLVIAQLKPGTSGSPDEWLSYMVTASSRPTTDSGYTVIDNGDGSYTVIFGKDIKNQSSTGTTVSYNANYTHRVMVGIRSTPSIALLNNGTTLSNFYNEKYLISTFVPATPDVAPTLVKDMTATAACNECHGKIGVTTPHGGRGDVKYCMMCHTSQRAIGRTNLTSVGGVVPARDPLLASTATSANYWADGEVLGEFVTMIHKIHMGEHLTKTGYNYAGVAFNEIVYPKDVRNCRQCHRAELGAQGDNWQTKPSRKACGACHDGINWSTGAGHDGGQQASDANCVGCHADAELLHMTDIATPNNPKVPAGLVNFFYNISSATVDGSNNLNIKFRIQKNTDSLTAAKSNVVFTGAGSTASTPPAGAVITGFSGSPSFLLAYFKESPNQLEAKYAGDYNNLRDTRTDSNAKAAQPKSVSIAALLASSGGTMSAPDNNGYYTATIPNGFPTGSKLRAVGLQGYFTQVAGTNSIAADNARHALSHVKPVNGDAVRRDVIDSAKCGNCHEWFEGHGGNRVVGKDTVGPSICTLCHVPNLTTSGRGAQKSLIDFIIANPVGTSLGAVTNFLTSTAFTGSITQGAKDAMTALAAALGTTDPTQFPEASNNFKDMVHGIHAGSDPLVVGTPLKFVRDRSTSGDFEYDFAEVTFPGVLKNCTMCHKGTTYTTIPSGVQVSTQVTSRGTTLTLQTDAVTGNNVTEVDAARKAVPNPQDLVNTPFVATCKACHNRPNALAHFAQMGGQVNVLRSQANPDNEACVTCHGTTGPNAIWNAHRFSVVGDD
ncbi:OmcA/MtrC family decaheme c-type cytochrome [Geomonas paludis]|uniref:OmcA/MtrC family decaheme c-type cytochrome n=1 Tax=Geomonas paludis TaxID=2740185 RepID=A0ABY4LFB0_9BACT|nr:OmcA/MtrC family decaheme c-type cytochrome [Geomonas paludis]UPU35167.1 OmcA/MtrC family decaheme c-type cytochrome [Geomonas paludis]